MTRSSRPALFRSLAVKNYRIFFWGGLVSNVGVWMQRTAQSWVVLHESGGNGLALGIVTFLQFAPTLFFSVLAGSISDRMDRARLLTITQALVGAESVVMSIFVATGVLDLTWVYVLAAALGIVTAFDAPVRQAFVSDLVGRNGVANAVGLNSASFNVARLVGPAVAGVMIGSVGTAAVFAVHAVSSVAIVTSLLRIDRGSLVEQPRAAGGDRRAGAAFRYLGRNRGILGFILLAGATGMVGANSLQVVLPLIATEVFSEGAVGFGLLTSALAVGSLAGALVASTIVGAPRPIVVFLTAALFGASLVVLSFMHGFVAFAIALVPCGFLFMAFVVSVNTSVQLATAPAVRGRVMAVYMMFFLGGTAAGGPLVGALCNLVGPEAAIACAGAFSLLVGLVAMGIRTARSSRRERPRPAEAAVSVPRLAA